MSKRCRRSSPLRGPADTCATPFHSTRDSQPRPCWPLASNRVEQSRSLAPAQALARVQAQVRELVQVWAQVRALAQVWALAQALVQVWALVRVRVQALVQVWALVRVQAQVWAQAQARVQAPERVSEKVLAQASGHRCPHPWPLLSRPGWYCQQRLPR
jgi:hypothetical protein